MVFFFFCFSFCNIVDNGRLSMQREHPVVARGTWPTHLSPLSLSLSSSMCHFYIWKSEFHWLCMVLPFGCLRYWFGRRKRKSWLCLDGGVGKGNLGTGILNWGFQRCASFFPPLHGFSHLKCCPRKSTELLQSHVCLKGKAKEKGYDIYNEAK